MKRVEVSTSLSFHGEPCWIWTGRTSGENKGNRATRGGGYPRMDLNGHTVAVHIVMYTHYFGYVPGKMTIDHECRSRLCVNPNHLSMVSHKENQRRRDGKKPHALTEYGVIIDVSDALAIRAKFKAEEIRKAA